MWVQASKQCLETLGHPSHPIQLINYNATNLMTINICNLSSKNNNIWLSLCNSHNMFAYSWIHEQQCCNLGHTTTAETVVLERKRQWDKDRRVLKWLRNRGKKGIESNMTTKQRGRLKQKNFREQMLDHLYWPNLFLVCLFRVGGSNQLYCHLLYVITQTIFYGRFNNFASIIHKRQGKCW